MFDRWTFGRRLAAGFGLATLVLIVIAAGLLSQYQQPHRELRLGDHTDLVRTDLADLQSFLKDAETGQRGYVITGETAIWSHTSRL